jgi:hypothetical protein
MWIKSLIWKYTQFLQISSNVLFRVISQPFFINEQGIILVNP